MWYAIHAAQQGTATLTETGLLGIIAITVIVSVFLWKIR